MIWSKKFRTFRYFTALTILWVVIFFALSALFHFDSVSQSFTPLLPLLTIHGLGSDDVGRDLVARVLGGGQIALELGILSLFGSYLVGIPLGLWSAFKKSWIDETLQRITDFGLGFPSILLGIVIVTLIGPGFTGLVVIVILINVPQVFRLVRNLAISELEKDYVIAATALGAKPQRILFQHILPSMMDALIITGTTLLGTAVLEAAGLSFLGLGIMPPNPDWGAMVAEYRKYILAAPRLFLAPSLAIVVFSGSYIFLAEFLRKKR